jgi:uncharacterized protein with beta-barrel porin domain
VSAVFETLPGGSFTVNGASLPHDSALITAGAQLLIPANWSLIANRRRVRKRLADAGAGMPRYPWRERSNLTCDVSYWHVADLAKV